MRLIAKEWPIEQQNDYKLVKAEMNGFDFNLRVLRPWARDPAFYVSVWAARSDCPLREGPLAYPAIELYNFKFPLSAESQRELTTRIAAIPALLTASPAKSEGQQRARSVGLGRAGIAQSIRNS